MTDQSVMTAEDRDLARRFVAGSLQDPELERFEERLLASEQLQKEVRFAAAVRDGSRTTQPRPGYHRVRTPRGRVLAVAAVAAAAALLLIVPRGPRMSDELRDLGVVVEPPIYLGLEVRNDASSGDSLLRVGLQDYQAGEYENAGVALRSAMDLGGFSSRAAFFAAASDMMLGRDLGADSLFSLVIEASESPYTPEAYFYRAKLHLRQGRPGPALEDLRVISELDSEVAVDAAALALRIEEAVER